MTKKIVLTIIIAILFAGAITGAYFGYEKLSEKYSPSATAPAGEKEEYKNFSMEDADGNTVKLSDFIGQPVVINFWSAWCAPCKSELPHFDKLAKEYDGRVKFLMVNVFYDGKKSSRLILFLGTAILFRFISTVETLPCPLTGFRLFRKRFLFRRAVK